VLRPLTAVGVLAALPLLAAGCGGQSAPDRRSAPSSVRLRVSAPADAALTRGATVQVAGHVSPARARVLVAGRAVQVTGGAFRTTVRLQEGANLIDVGAWAPRTTGSWVALRVVRQTLVTVPDVVGAVRDDAMTALEGRGLQVSVVDQDSFLDKLLPGDQLVCETRPGAGAAVRAGRTIDVVVSKSC
jgi:hypothetical protein